MSDNKLLQSEIRWGRLLIHLAIYAICIAIVIGTGAAYAESLTTIVAVPLVLALVGMALIYLQSRHDLKQEKTRDSNKALLKLEIEFYGVLGFIGGAGLIIFNAHDLALSAAGKAHDATEAKWEYLVTAAGLLGFSAIAAGKKLAIAFFDLSTIREKERAEKNKVALDETNARAGAATKENA